MSPVVPSHSARYFLASILLVSFLIRLPLAFDSGGHFLWADEQRFGIALDVARQFADGHWHSGADLLLGTSDHIFFRFIGAGIALLGRCFFEGQNLEFYGAMLELFPVGSIGLVWLLARHATGQETAATWSAFFYAGCVTAFFFGRHFFSYDPALSLLLFGWWIGLGSASLGRFFSAGVVIGLGYLTYNGYWSIGGIILVSLVFGFKGTPVERLYYAAIGGAGLLLPIAVIYGCAALLGHDLIAHARGFSQSVTQGDFGEGWRFLPSYIVSAERGYAFFLLG